MNAPTLNRRLWAGAVLRAVAKVPAGDKLPIAAIARQLGIAQADCIQSVELLITEGRLDRTTLRPPVTFEPVAPAVAPSAPAPADDSTPPAGAIPFDITGEALFDRLVDEGRRRGLSVRQVSLQVFNSGVQIYGLRKRDYVRPVTLERAGAWLGQVIAAAPTSSGPSPEAQQLLADIEQFLVRHDMTPDAFGKGAVNNGALVRRMRTGLGVKPASIVRIRAFMASPPAPKPKLAPKPARRAAMDGEQRAAAVRRGVGQQALAILDGKAPIVGVSPVVRGAMTIIQDQRDAQARLQDPVEQAKLALRQRGRVVFDASVSGGTKGRFFVSGQNDPDTGKRLQLTPADLAALAWKVNPLRMQQLTGKDRPDARR